MKGIVKSTALVGLVSFLGACSSMVAIPERDSYAQPDWYAKCANTGSEGYFWWKKEYAYACGAGESRFQQAAEEQMYAVAMNNFAKRINGVVNSETKLEFVNDQRSTFTKISYVVKDTAITQHLEEERGTFVYNGQQYTFVKLKMPKDVFDQLVSSEARQREYADNFTTVTLDSQE